MNRPIIAIMWKDIRDITRRSATFLPMIIVPLLITGLLPVALVLAVKLLDPSSVNGMEEMGALLNMYSLPAELTDQKDQMLYVFLNYTFLPLFLIVPVMVTAIIGTNALMGEKERKTLETLLYAPISQGNLLLAKALAALVPGVLVALVSWLMLWGGTGLAALALGGPLLVTSWLWLPTLAVLVPSLTFFELAVTLMVCIKAKTFLDAQQLSSLVVLPLVASMYSQIAGILQINLGLVLGIALGLGAAGALLLKLAGRHYTREALIARL